jgi:endonuclease YncB( thermonuclease family)
MKMISARAFGFTSLLSILALQGFGQSRAPSPKTAADFKGAASYRVLRVVDGDTAVLMIAGKSTTVRLIGVDTPETVHPSKPLVVANYSMPGNLRGKKARIISRFDMRVRASSRRSNPISMSVAMSRSTVFSPLPA